MDLQPIDNQPDDDAKPATIPPRVWQTLQQAGSVAADRLLAMLEGKAFSRLKPSDQARLVELALNRAYGPPIKREARLELRGNVSDAVADSLARLSSVDLPEHNRHNARNAAREQGQEAQVVSMVGKGSLDPDKATHRPSRRRKANKRI